MNLKFFCSWTISEIFSEAVREGPSVFKGGFVVDFGVEIVAATDSNSLRVSSNAYSLCSISERSKPCAQMSWIRNK